LTSKTPTYEQIVALALGELDGEASAAVEAGVRESPRAAQTLNRVRAMIATMRSDDTEAAPAGSIAAAKAIFQPPVKANRAGWLDRVDELLGRLVFDSRAQPALAGYRGAEDGFSLTFESEAGVVDVQIDQAVSEDRTGSRWRLLGQLDSDGDVGGAEVALAPAGSRRPIRHTTADAHGMFNLPVEGGRYDLLIQLGRRTIVLPGIEVS
jgi:hypothetical protein